MGNAFIAQNKLSSSKIFRKFAGPLEDDDAIKTSIATDDTDDNTYEDTDLDGVMGQLSKAPFGRTLTVTTAAAAGAYAITDPIIITGFDSSGNVEITEEFQITDADGGEVLEGTKAFSSVTSIFVPIQADNDGALKFGVRNLITPHCRELKIGVAGDLTMAFLLGSDIYLETATFDAGERLPLSPLYIDYTSTVEDIVCFV